MHARLWLIATLAMGCEAATHDVLPDSATTIDAGELADLVPGTLATTFESLTRVSNANGVLIEDVSYRSQDLLIRGRICRPSAAGSHPVVFVNHGGFQGYGDTDLNSCASSAQAGYVAALSQYRGQGGSEGNIEFCNGEVVDVLNLVHVVLAQPYADPTRAGMVGASHGGCVALRAAALGVPVQAVADFFGPTDLVSEFHHLKESETTASPDLQPTFTELVAIATQVTGGTPEEVPAAYAARSPASRPSKLRAFPGAILVVNGNDDPLVLPSQSCTVAAQMELTETYHLDANQRVTTTAPASCDGFTWKPGPAPQAAWPAARYFMIFDGMGHEESSTAAMAALYEATLFLAAKTTH